MLVPLTWLATFADLHVFVPKQTIEYPILHCYSTWSAMFGSVYMFCKQLLMCKYPRNTFSLLYVCRIGLGTMLG